MSLHHLHGALFGIARAATIKKTLGIFLNL
jgi:hypothetical protein